MKTYRHFWRYLAKFFLEWEMFLTKLVEKIRTHILYSVTFIRKSHRLWDNVEKLGGDRGATNDATTWSIRIACYISKATYTYSHEHARTDQYVILVLRFHGNSDSRTHFNVTLHIYRQSCFYHRRLVSPSRVSHFCRTPFETLASLLCNWSIWISLFRGNVRKLFGYPS